MMMSSSCYPATSDAALRLFLNHFGLNRAAPPEQLLRQVTVAFARLPYENLTKIIKEASAGSCDQARRAPAEVVADHVALGTGGTCFSLTATLLHLLRTLGWRAEPILADRPYGADTHCALLVWLQDRPHLVDPGYLITEPIALGGGEERRLPTSFHEILLTPTTDRSKLELRTILQGQATHRITFKTDPVDEGQFVKVWNASFDWDMMCYPVLSRIAGGQHQYLQGNRLQTRGRNSVSRLELQPADLAAYIADTFGVDARIAAQALTLLHRRGEKHGRSPVA
jgi:arylamine N-acetyltransferase